MANPPLTPLDQLLESSTRRTSDMGNSTLLLDRLAYESRQRMAMDAMYSKSSQDMMRTWMLRAQMANMGNSMVVSPVVSGLGLPYNPLNPIDAMAKILGIGTVYQNQRLQTRALMGPAGASAVAEFDSSGVDRFAKSLQAIGASRTDALQTMQALVTMSRQISTSMADATMAVMNFSKATGLDRGAVASAVGSAVVASNMTLNQNTATQLFGNLQTLARGNNALIMPTAQAVQGFREMALQRGRAVTFNAYGVDNATNLMASFINMDPTVYGQRPDIAMRHASQLSSAGQGMFLGIAMDIAARAGRPTDIASVMAALQNQESWMMVPLSKELSSRGMRDVAAMYGIDAQFLLKGGLGGGFTPSTSRDFKTFEDLAQQYTSEQDQLRAGQTMAGETLGEGPSSGISGAINSLPTPVKYIGGVALGGIGLAGTVLLGSKTARQAVTRRIADRRARKAAAEAAEKYIGQSYDEWLMEGAEGAAKAGANRAGVKAGAKVGLKGLGKVGMKALPFVGAAWGLYDAANRGMDGDYFGAAMEVTAGAASFFGPWGLGASVAIQGALAARDIAKAGDAELAGEPTATAGPPRLDINALASLPDTTSFKAAPWRNTLPANIVQFTPQKDIFQGYGAEGRNRAEAIAAGMAERGFMLGLSRSTGRDGRSSLNTYAVDPRTGAVRKDPAAVTALNEVSDRVENQLRDSLRPSSSGTSAKDLTQALTTLTTALTTLNTTLTSQAGGTSAFIPATPFSPYKRP